MIKVPLKSFKSVVPTVPTSTGEVREKGVGHGISLGAESSAAAFQTSAPIVTGTDNPVVDPETGDWVLRPDDVDAMVSAAAPFVSSSRE